MSFWGLGGCYVLQKQPKPGYFKQFRNPGQNMSPRRGTFSHLIVRVVLGGFKGVAILGRF